MAERAFSLMNQPNIQTGNPIHFGEDAPPVFQVPGAASIALRRRSSNRLTAAFGAPQNACSPKRVAISACPERRCRSLRTADHIYEPRSQVGGSNPFNSCNPASAPRHSATATARFNQCNGAGAICSRVAYADSILSQQVPWNVGARQCSAEMPASA